MSVTVKPYSRGWQVDVLTRLPDGSRYRERRRLRLSSKSAALRWGQDHERHVLRHGRPQAKKEVPTLEEFAPRFLDGHARANRQKPSGIAAKEVIVRVHLLPAWCEAAQLDRERGCAATETSAAQQGTEDSQQHPDGVERDAEEGG